MRALPCAMIGMTAAAWVAAVAWTGGLRLNTTSSMPRGLWHVAAPDTGPRRGEIVSVCLPEGETARQGLERGYLMAGFCESGTQPLLKPVGAVAGDTVTIRPGGVLIVNGAASGEVQAMRQDSAGRPMARVAEGTYQVAPGEVWLLSQHVPNSWDSRYWGPVPVTSVQGIAHPVLVW